MRVCAAIIALVSLLGCAKATTPAVGTLVVHIDTNAPVLTNDDRGRSMALFDSVRVEVLTADGDLACPTCQREFPASEDQFRQGLSFGITKPSRTDLRITARMFLSTLAGTEIDARVTVTASALLQNGGDGQVPDEGARHVSLFLEAAEVGAKGQTVPLQPYVEHDSLVFTWAWANRIPCVRKPRADEACIFGGAFWLGAASGALTVQPERSARRVIALKPFFLLDHEVTVAELRPFLDSHPEFDQMVNVWSGSISGENPTDWCTYTKMAGELDEYPVNCVADDLARAYCQAEGGDLPSEAQFEYVAGALSGHPFVWGLDIPTCEVAVYGRHTSLTAWTTSFSDSSCVGAAPEERDAIGSPMMSRASPTRDTLIVNGHAIHHIAGNLSEWTLDEYDGRDSACWTDLSRPNFAIEPVCKQGPIVNEARRHEHSRAVRGGSWLEGMPALASNYRFEQEFGLKTAWVGFRCARPGGPTSP